MISIIIPTCNARDHINGLLLSLKRPPGPYEILVIDSSSSDDTVEIARAQGAKVVEIEGHLFDHGGTRTLAGKMAGGEFLVYLTQDAQPENEHSIESLIKPLREDKEIGASYGRQLAYPGSSPLCEHLRLFNYPPESCLKSKNDKEKWGIKTVMFSNAFSAYRREALEEIGWFKENLIICEDTDASARLLRAGYKIAYLAEAKVYHSHDYSIGREFKRYFDIGVFHEKEKWILQEFGKAEGEGIKYIRSELTFLLDRGKLHLIPEALIRNLMKFVGYRLGRNHELFPRKFNRILSMHQKWWDRFDG